MLLKSWGEKKTNVRRLDVEQLKAQALIRPCSDGNRRLVQKRYGTLALYMPQADLRQTLIVDDVNYMR